jgi:hypothetical protein
MSHHPRRFIVIISLALAASWPAAGQPVYKCGRSADPTYSDRPCSHRMLDTTPAHGPADRAPTWVEQERVLARSLRRLPGESAAHFAARRRRTAMPQADRDECERLETRIPVEQARTTMPDAAEAAAGQAALRATRSRFAHLHC